MAQRSQQLRWHMGCPAIEPVKNDRSGFRQYVPCIRDGAWKQPYCKDAIFVDVKLFGIYIYIYIFIYNHCFVLFLLLCFVPKTFGDVPYLLICSSVFFLNCCHFWLILLLPHVLLSVLRFLQLLLLLQKRMYLLSSTCFFVAYNAKYLHFGIFGVTYDFPNWHPLRWHIPLKKYVETHALSLQDIYIYLFI